MILRQHQISQRAHSRLSNLHRLSVLAIIIKQVITIQSLKVLARSNNKRVDLVLLLKTNHLLHTPKPPSQKNMMTIIFYLKKIGNLLPQKILDFQNIASTMKSNIQTSNKIMSLQRKFKTHMNKHTLIKNQRVILHLIKNINLKNQIAILHTNKHIK